LRDINDAIFAIFVFRRYYIYPWKILACSVCGTTG